MISSNFYNPEKVRLLSLTSLWEKLGINITKSILLHHTGRTFRLKSAIYPLNLILREACKFAKRFDTFRPVARRTFDVIQVRICKDKPIVNFIPIKLLRKSYE